MCSKGVSPYAPLQPNEALGESTLRYENRNVEELYARYENPVPAEQEDVYREVVRRLLADPPEGENEYHKKITKIRRDLRFAPKKALILQMYLRMVKLGEIDELCKDLRMCLVTKASKSQSGVLVITVLTSPTPTMEGGKPQNFSCKWDCHYCPDQPGQPRSYLRDEPAVRRANQNQFDPVLQFLDRAYVLYQNGHPADKVELLVLGGTWHSYPLEYQETFCRDLFYAANTFLQPSRERLSLEEEQNLNEYAKCKIIGLTLETRPDCINAEELRRLRRYGCTRVQLGLQHTDDGVLKHINRGHTVDDAVEAIRLLKDSCYKMDIHLMPNLPGSTVDMDNRMFDRVLGDEDLQADQWKIYPCEVLPWTRIEKWYREGEYKPYGEAAMAKLIARVKGKIHPWIRLNRIVRDIPVQYIVAGSSVPNFREEILSNMRKEGSRCRCIRCRECGDIGGWQQGAEQLGQGKRLANREGKMAHDRSRQKAREAVLTTRHYKGSRGDEYFISYEAPGDVLCGFARLRLSNRAYFPEGLFPELQGAGLLRELHVYGQLVATDEKKSNAQHVGFGTHLMAEAENIAFERGFDKLAVIAGVGTRNYYRKLGYEMEGEGDFLIKHFKDGTKLPVPPRGTIARSVALDLPFVLKWKWALWCVLVLAFCLQWAGVPSVAL